MVKNVKMVCPMLIYSCSIITCINVMFMVKLFAVLLNFRYERLHDRKKATTISLKTLIFVKPLFTTLAYLTLPYI